MADLEDMDQQQPAAGAGSQVVILKFTINLRDTTTLEEAKHLQPLIDSTLVLVKPRAFICCGCTRQVLPWRQFRQRKAAHRRSRPTVTYRLPSHRRVSGPWADQEELCSGQDLPRLQQLRQEYMAYHHNCMKLSWGDTGDLMNLVFKMKTCRCYIFDLSRTKPKTFSNEDLYSAIEDIENGYIVNTKYETGFKQFAPPHVIVFANTPPNQSCLTRDRSGGSGDFAATAVWGIGESLASSRSCTRSRSSDGEKPKPRIVQVIDYGESASQPLLHADDCVYVWNPLGHNGHGSEYRPSAHVVSVKWTHVRLFDMAVTTYCSLPPMETSRPAYAVNPRDLQSWAQPLVYFCTDDSMHSYPLVARPLRTCSSKLARGDARGSAGQKGDLDSIRRHKCLHRSAHRIMQPHSSSCHSTTRLSGDGSAFAPHDSAGTDNGESTVLNGGDGVAEQCSTSCNNIREASVLSSDGSACVRHESAGTGDGDPTVLNGGLGVAEQGSASCNNIREAAVLSSDGSTSVPRSLEGSDVDLAPVPCDVMPATTTHPVCREDICAALAASAGICSVFTDPTGDSGAGKVARPGVGCDSVSGGVGGVSISMASPLETTASDANSSRPDEEDSPAVLNSSSETHAAPTALSVVNPTCLSNNGDAGTQQAVAGSGHDMATGDHGSGTALTAATEPSAAGAPPRTSVAKAPSARSSGARHPSRQCTHCEMLGHFVARCWKLHPQLRRNSSPIQAASTGIASREQSSAAQTPMKRRGGDNTHRHAGARLRATAGSKSSAGASNHIASKEERALRKQVAQLKQNAAVLRERLAVLESRGKESAVPADAHAASCCSGQQSTAFRAALQAVVERCQQLLAGAADSPSTVTSLNSALADGCSGVSDGTSMQQWQQQHTTAAGRRSWWRRSRSRWSVCAWWGPHVVEPGPINGGRTGSGGTGSYNNRPYQQFGSTPGQGQVPVHVADMPDAQRTGAGEESAAANPVAIIVAVTAAMIDELVSLGDAFDTFEFGDVVKCCLSCTDEARGVLVSQLEARHLIAACNAALIPPVCETQPQHMQQAAGAAQLAVNNVQRPDGVQLLKAFVNIEGTPTPGLLDPGAPATFLATRGFMLILELLRQRENDQRATQLRGEQRQSTYAASAAVRLTSLDSTASVQLSMAQDAANVRFVVAAVLAGKKVLPEGISLADIVGCGSPDAHRALAAHGDNSEVSSDSGSTLSGERVQAYQQRAALRRVDTWRHSDVIDGATASHRDHGTSKRYTDRCHHRWHYGDNSGQKIAADKVPTTPFTVLPEGLPSAARFAAQGQFSCGAALPPGCLEHYTWWATLRVLIGVTGLVVTPSAPTDVPDYRLVPPASVTSGCMVSTWEPRDELDCCASFTDDDEVLCTAYERVVWTVAGVHPDSGRVSLVCGGGAGPNGEVRPNKDFEAADWKEAWITGEVSPWAPQVGEVVLYSSSRYADKKAMPSIAQVTGHAQPVSHPFSKVTDMVRFWHPRLGREVEIPAWQLAPCWLPRNTRLLARCGLPGVTTGDITMLVEVECSFDGQARLRDIRDGYGGVLVRPIINGNRQPAVMLAWHKLQPLGRSVSSFCTLPPDRALTDSYVMAPTDVEEWARPLVYASSPSLLDCAYTCNTFSPLRAWLSSDGYRVSSHRPKNGLQGLQMQPSVLQRSSYAGYAPAVAGGETRSQCSGVGDGAAGKSLRVPMCSAVQVCSGPGDSSAHERLRADGDHARAITGGALLTAVARQGSSANRGTTPSTRHCDIASTVIGGDADSGAQTSTLSIGGGGAQLHVDSGGRVGDARRTSAPTTTAPAAAETSVLARTKAPACVPATVQAGAAAAQADAMEAVAEHGFGRMESAGGEISSGTLSAADRLPATARSAATGDGLLIAVSASTSVSGSDAAEMQSLNHVAIGEGIILAGLPVPQVADGSSRGRWEDRTPVGSGACAACERGSDARNPQAISNVGVSAPPLVKGVDGSAQGSGTTSSPTTLCDPALGAPQQHMPQAEVMSTAAQAGVTAAQAGASGAVAKRRIQSKDTAFAEVALQSAVPQGKDTGFAVVAHQSGLGGEADEPDGEPQQQKRSTAGITEADDVHLVASVLEFAVQSACSAEESFTDTVADAVEAAGLAAAEHLLNSGAIKEVELNEDVPASDGMDGVNLVYQVPLMADQFYSRQQFALVAATDLRGPVENAGSWSCCLRAVFCGGFQHYDGRIWGCFWRRHQLRCQPYLYSVSSNLVIACQCNHTKGGSGGMATPCFCQDENTRATSATLLASTGQTHADIIAITDNSNNTVSMRFVIDIHDNNDQHHDPLQHTNKTQRTNNGSISPQNPTRTTAPWSCPAVPRIPLRRVLAAGPTHPTH
ncbi:hypothetical protein JKP88DRAFT_245412 [Tribonema minus]|uniref:Uncharacterized protein n=1 Tax=Tribonema minus TaxID=303371 RepID=A0A835YZ93_9STRA|nr:hypothetical protein JKP88DRAFT_245412 [Tribonema minus]